MRVNDRTKPHADRPVGKEKRQILLHLERDLIKELKKAALDLESSASAIASEAIGDWLKKNGLRGG